MTLAELALASHWAFGLVISDEDVTTQAVNAARQYLGWGTIASLEPAPAPAPAPVPLAGDAMIVGWYGGVYGGPPLVVPAPPPEPPPPPTPLSEEAEISDSEWAVIRPLFMLYVERENARALEASRSQGVDVYGRAVDVIEADIRQYEVTDMPRLAFATGPMTF